MSTILNNLKNTTIITMISWLVVIALLILHLLIHSLFTLKMFLLFTLGAMICGLFFVASWLQFISSSIKSKWKSFIIYYSVLVLLIYGVGYFCDIISGQKIPYFPLKVLMLFHILLGIYCIYLFVAMIIVRLMNKILYQQGIMIHEDVKFLIQLLIAIVGAFALYWGFEYTDIFNRLMMAILSFNH